MQKVLFKAKRIDTGEWIYWNVYGELCRKSGKRARVSIRKGASTSYYDYIHQIVQLIDKETICQYTGLTDKNGKKIWENDVVSCGGNLVVMWNERFASFCLGKNGWMYNHFFGEAIEGCDCEVIGNIFDNPELLGE